MDSLPPLSEVFHRCLGSVFEGEVLHSWNNVDSGSRNFLCPSFWPVLTCHRILVTELYEYGFVMERSQCIVKFLLGFMVEKALEEFQWSVSTVSFLERSLVLLALGPGHFS